MSDYVRDLPAEDMRALCEQAAESLGLPSAAFVEKDFWAMEVLRSLSAPFEPAAGADTVRVVFKGGTSLSKAFGLIARFSDDIDVMLEHPSGETLSRKAPDREFLTPLTNRIASDLVFADDQIEPLERGHFHRNTRFAYAECLPPGAHSRGVRLEMSFRDSHSVIPGTREASLRSYISEHLGDEAFADTSAFDVLVLSPCRTLIEKLCIVENIYASWKNGDDHLAKNARHVYDIHQLLQSAEVQDELPTVDVADVSSTVVELAGKYNFKTGSGARPSEGFGRSAAYEDEQFLAALEESYAGVQPLVYDDFPSLGQCLAAVKANSDLL